MLSRFILNKSSFSFGIWSTRVFSSSRGAMMGSAEPKMKLRGYVRVRAVWNSVNGKMP
jgi:hypothetical protein